MKNKNIPLVLGSVILLALLVIMFFPDLFATQSPYTVQHMRFTHVDGTLDINRAPYAPDRQFLLGSDHLGRDIFSYMIYGTGLTISMGLLIAFCEFILAVPLALIAGFDNKIVKTVIEKTNVLFSAIPALLIAIIILNLDYFAGQDKAFSILSFVVILTAVGWARVGVLVLERVEGIMVQPFIIGEIAIGKSSLKIAVQNVLPHLAPEIIVLYFMEVARSLSILMQLGIFAVFVGNLGLINDPTAGVPINLDISYEPEWASMLSTSRTLLTTAPWAVLYPALAFFISVLGFNLFGEGLRIVMQQQGFRFKTHYKSLVRSAAIVVAVLFVFAAINFKSYSVGFSELDAMPSSVFVGTDEAALVSAQIADKMKALGIDPIKENAYMMPYEIGDVSMIVKQEMALISDETEKAFIPNKDFAFVETNDVIEKATLVDARKMDLFTMKEPEMFDKKFVLIDGRYYSEPAVAAIIDEINFRSAALGIFIIVDDDKDIGNLTVMSSQARRVPVVEITENIAQQIATDPNVEIRIEATVAPLDNQGRNVVGILEGDDPTLGEEAIVVGFGYNYIDQSGKDALRFNLSLMEQICALDENKRSVIFVYLDGTLTDRQNGIHALSEMYPYSSGDTQVYLDLTDVSTINYDAVTYSGKQAPVTRPFAWGLSRQIEEGLTDGGYLLKPLPSIFIDGSYYFEGKSASNAMFWNRGIPSIVIGTEVSGSGKHEVEQLGRLILKAIAQNNY